MKIITTPPVYVLGRQEVESDELDRFLCDHGVTWQTDSEVGAEVLAETAGRVCYMSFAKPRPGGNAAYLGHIKEVGHGSVLEHAVWNVLITGVSRSLSHELVRHRAGFGFSQLSQRYVDESVAEYVVPPDLKEEVTAAETFEAWTSGYMETSDEGMTEAARAFHDKHPALTREAVAAGQLWIDTVRSSHIGYGKLSEYLARKATARGLEKTEARKFARQAARSVLPNATETKLFVTANARALRHFFEQRGSRHADPEIRQLAVALWDRLSGESASLFGDYAKAELPDGTHELTTPNRKV